MHSKTKKFKYSRATEKQLYRKPDISRQKYFFKFKNAIHHTLKQQSQYV